MLSQRKSCWKKDTTESRERLGYFSRSKALNLAWYSFFSCSFYYFTIDDLAIDNLQIAVHVCTSGNWNYQTGTATWMMQLAKMSLEISTVHFIFLFFFASPMINKIMILLQSGSRLGRGRPYQTGTATWMMRTCNSWPSASVRYSYGNYFFKNSTQ